MTLEAFRAPGVAMSRPSRKRKVPTGAGSAEHDQGGPGLAYDADGLEVLGLGAGLDGADESAAAYALRDGLQDVDLDHQHHCEGCRCVVSLDLRA